MSDEEHLERAQQLSDAAAAQDSAYVPYALDTRNWARESLIWISLTAAVIGLIALFAGAANLSVVDDLTGNTSAPGLPWVFIGAGLLNVGILGGFCLLVVAAVRWKASEQS